MRNPTPLAERRPRLELRMADAAVDGCRADVSPSDPKLQQPQRAHHSRKSLRKRGAFNEPALPDVVLTSTVRLDAGTAKASEAFDFKFNGTSQTSLVESPAQAPSQPPKREGPPFS